MPLTTRIGKLDYTYTEPQGWEFDNADWANPDPSNTDYWRAVILAILERQDAAGSIDPNLGRALSVNPFFPVAASVDKIRDSIFALVPRFVDWDATVEAVDAMPTSADGAPPTAWYKVRDVYNAFPDFAACPGHGATAEQLTAFLRDCKTILQTLRVSDWRWGLYHQTGVSRSATGGDRRESGAEANEEARNALSGGEYESYKSVTSFTVRAEKTQYAQQDRDGEGGYSSVVEATENARIIADNTPSQTILGAPWDAEMVCIYNSHNFITIIDGVHVPPEYREYYSANFTEGWGVQRYPHEWEIVESTEWPRLVVCTYNEGTSGTSRGSLTWVYPFADWGECFKFAPEPPEDTPQIP